MLFDPWGGVGGGMGAITNTDSKSLLEVAEDAFFVVNFFGTFCAAKLVKHTGLNA